MGSSGSGKSTIMRLLQRLYDPTVGALKLDGRAPGPARNLGASDAARIPHLPEGDGEMGCTGPRGGPALGALTDAWKTSEFARKKEKGGACPPR